jgi:hypothetical protein
LTQLDSSGIKISVHALITSTQTMKIINNLRRMALLSGALLVGASAAFAQSTTSAISGVVLSETGAPIAGANVSVTHEPTGSVVRAVSRSNGTFTLQNLRPGGPYTARSSAQGFRPAALEGFSLALDQVTDVTLVMRSAVEELLELDEFVAQGLGSGLFSSARTGVGTNITSRDIETTPTADRSLLSIARLDPRITYNADPQDQAISASGASNRYNSIQIDGVNAGDPFGLTANNAAARRNVIPLEAVEAVSISTSPFALRNAGFTGAQVNAVTRSGTNQFSGVVYMTYRDENFAGDKIDGVDSPIPPFEELTLGFAIGGPIIQDKLFFFVAYERVREDNVAPSTRFLPTPEALGRITAAASALGVNPGEFAGAGTGTAKLEDDNILIKIDWNITENHRATFRYNTVDSVSPAFSNINPTSSIFSTHFWAQEIENTSYVGQLFSTWSDRLSTEISVSYSEYASAPTFAQRLPMVEIFNVPLVGSTQPGRVTFGTERSRHFNRLEVDTFNIEAIASLELNERNTLDVGIQFDTSDVFNAFVQDFLGRYRFSSIDTFENAGNAGWGVVTGGGQADIYNLQFENPGVNPAAEFTERNTGVFIQNTYRPNTNFTLTGGVRIDIPSFGDAPDFNQTLFDAFGERNDRTFDGNYVLQPRLGFNYIIDGERTTQFRGGIGLFYGRMPRVWMSNSYSNTGFNFQSLELRGGAVPAFSGDPDGQFEGQAAARAQQVAFLGEDFKLPTSWKAVLGVDHEVGVFDLVLSLEAEFTRVENDVFFENINLRSVGTLPDGRTRYQGVNDARFTNRLIKLTNTSLGGSQSYTVSLERPRQEDGWFARMSYVYTEATEAQFGTSSVAASNWNNRAVFNQDEQVRSRAELEIRNRLLGILQKDFEFAEGWLTRIGLIYEGRSGLPYSLVVNGDINGDTVNGNDLLFVPNRGGDNRVRFDSAATEQLFFQMVDRLGLQEGAPVARAGQRYPWVNRFDLSITQNVPLPGWRHNLEVGFDILNVGNLLNSSWGLVEGSNQFFLKRETAVTAAFDAANNQLVYSNVNQQLAAGEFNVATGRGEPSPSRRWTALLSVRYRF